MARRADLIVFLVNQWIAVSNKFAYIYIYIYLHIYTYVYIYIYYNIYMEVLAREDESDMEFHTFAGAQAKTG